ncbi:dihydrofolate reductase [Leifsonia sp. AG29]|uniref:dihydrofolate reductase n=1 Tax=Leifsonia sp. AG29 TaxID=2598860 RepID=UPI00131DC04F|nr:dihydrofolate reductase [Leifsonia sp. AG29]
MTPDERARSQPRPAVALIWAQAKGRVIGAGGVMPWHLPEDLRHFRQLTDAEPVVMGRRTWESLPDRFRPLPGRVNIVVTRKPDWEAPGATTAHSLQAALDAAAQAAGSATVWVMGGAELYSQSLPLADRVELTEIDLVVTGDTFAPELGPEWSADPAPWRTAESGTRYRFLTYRR